MTKEKIYQLFQENSTQAVDSNILTEDGFKNCVDEIFENTNILTDEELFHLIDILQLSKRTTEQHDMLTQEAKEISHNYNNDLIKKLRRMIQDKDK